MEWGWNRDNWALWAISLAPTCACVLAILAVAFAAGWLARGWWGS